MRRTLLIAGVALGSTALGLAAACSPMYVLKAGWEEAKILRARRPLPAVILDPATDERTRGKLTLAREAREFARTGLGLNVGDSYTTYTVLERDTLAMVLSAAHRDRLVSKTWWFPIVGNVPYKGFFDLGDAKDEQADLEEEGFDTYLRPTSAFSTLGWFSDPLLSTIVRYDEVDLVETIIHELSHNHLFLPGQVRFNESFASWVGRAGSIEFFCTRPGGGHDTVRCKRAKDRWHDEVVFSTFIDELVAALEAVYGDPGASREQKIELREAVFAAHKARFSSDVQPRLKELSFQGFTSLPLNNATLLSRMLYYHRLADFDALAEGGDGSLRHAIQRLEEEARAAADPFDLLPS